MLRREAAPSSHIDPRLEQRTAPDGSSFWFEPRSLEFFHEPRYYQSSKSGILAETMGLGKTIICLAVILATKGHSPEAPIQYDICESKRPHGPRTLLHHAIAKAGRHAIPIQSHLDRTKREKGLDLSHIMDEVHHNPVEYLIPHIPTRANSRRDVRPPQKKRLCRGTIIVAPRNLVHQWRLELRKHVAPGALRLLVCDSSKLKLPSAEVLSTYDIVLFSKSRFEMESKDGSDSQNRTTRNVPAGCRCPYIKATRTRDCTCLKNDDIYASPLKQLHWLRIIVDEGHEFSSRTSDAVLVAEKLVTADRRWVVSGTPGKHKLFGVEVDMAAQADSDELLAGEQDGSATPSSIASTSSRKDAHLMREEALAKRKNYNTHEEKGGAAKSIGILTSHFLQVRPWAKCSEEPKSDWDEYMYRHESYTAKTYTSFSLCLKKTLKALVIKVRSGFDGSCIKLTDLFRRDQKTSERTSYFRLWRIESSTSSPASSTQ